MAIALLAFAGMMAWFMVKAVRDPETLVSEQYYADELLYQERMEATARAGAYSTPVGMDVQRTHVGLSFPPELAGQRIEGTLELQRPNIAVADRDLPFSTDSGSTQFQGVDLLPGRYNATLHWTIQGRTHVTEEKVVVP